MLSRQNFCRDEHVFVVTNICSDKTVIATKIFCRNKQNFVSASILFLSRQKRVLSRQTRVCRDKTFVATKIMLVAAPAKDSGE